MSIGIIGSGHLGGGFARALARKNIPALISNRRGPESLRALIEELGPSIKAATVAEAAQADIFFLAGDDADAKAEIAKLIGQLDLTSIDLGPLDVGGRLFELPFGPLSVINLVKT